MRYGIPFQGSKNALAAEVVSLLPSAPRFVDLFAGGCALAHAAALCGRYKEVVANDLSHAGISVFWEGLCGDYAGESRWISREDFMILKDCDPFVALVWSFGNNRRQYLYGADIEPYKRALHFAYFNGDYAPAHDLYGLDLSPLQYVPEDRRAKAMWKICEDAFRNGRLPRLGKRIQMCYLQHLGRIRDIQALANSADAIKARLDIRCGDYRNVGLRDGDCIVCDIPYGKTCGYGDGGFDRDGFCKWASELDMPVFVFEYEMPRGFSPIWGKGRWDTFGRNGKKSMRGERLWVQSRYAYKYQFDFFMCEKGREYEP